MNDDTISRAAAIEVMRKAKDKSELHRMLVQLPSAQPVVISKSENATECEDAVSKEAVSSWLKQYGQDVLHGKYKFSLMYIWKKLMDLPSVTPKQPGWIPWDSGRFPEESGTYTVTAYDGATKRVTYAKYQKRLKRWELTGSRAYWKVLAWHELPTPYREGGQDGKN